MKCINDYLEDDSTTGDLLAILYGMREIDKKIFSLLFDASDPMNIDEISDEVGRERSTIYRSVENLVETDCVKIEKEGLESGGYRKLYYTLPPEKLRQQMKQDLDEWQEEAYRKIDSLVEKMNVDE
jgi:predicted transcriptional regulator